MKNNILSGILILSILTSCEKNDKEVFFKIENFEYKFSDIELYDTSTHIIYFKKVHDELREIEKGIFTFLDNGMPIYSGSLWPGYSSSMPTGPFIMTPPIMSGNHALRIDYRNSDKPDIRNSPLMIDIMNRHDLLHSGLHFSSVAIENAGTQLTFRFTVTNQDQSDLLIIDLNKTGPNLFHYFTNGPYIYDLAHNEIFSSNIQHQAPDPWNSWKTDWLSELKSGESKEFTIIYTLSAPLNPGEYETTFKFPGLAHQVTKDQLFQGNSRIWFGDISFKKRILIP